MSFWAVVQTQPLRERLVVDEFARAGFEAYCPRIRIRENLRWKTPPLFPNYVFVCIVDRWWLVRWTLGVVRILMDGEMPARVPHCLIDEIRGREIEGFVKLPNQDNGKCRGQKVKIIRGSFEGQIAIYDGMIGKERDRVLLELLGQVVPVELPAKDITPLIVAVSRETR